MSTPNEKFREVEMETKLKLVKLEKIVPKQKLSANGVEIVKCIENNSVQLKMQSVTPIKRRVIIPGKSVYLSADSSSYGIVAMLYQIQDRSKRPIANSSRTLSASERGCAQIEKKTLAVVWGCGKFHVYIVGLAVNIETGHKPLVPIFMHKALDLLDFRE
ncbi:hypothetical protein AVEN_209510-1 [Araneus ventricosus]|uniref:Reverse transcriptase RNase H-like domain-containing protein n=1 Tax=Araneus ventricosus TaxID=182803 RepID=A0A4Y2IPP5_ARAVE|nr:hypothetical protein AVEN_209510-1 [Araneus ventricosus]